MCEPITAGLIITAVLTTGAVVYQAEEAKKTEKRAVSRAEQNRARQEEREANIQAASREANTAKDLNSAGGSDRDAQRRKSRGKKLLRSPVPVLGGLSSQPSLGGLGGTTPPKPAAPKPPTQLGGI